MEVKACAKVDELDPWFLIPAASAPRMSNGELSLTVLHYLYGHFGDDGGPI